MERVEFTGPWKSLLAEQGLKKFSDFYKCPGGKCVNKNKKRDVYALHLNVGGENKKFYLKRFHNPYFKDILFTLLNSGKIYSQGGYEWRNIHLLKKNNIGTSSPVCFGEKLWLGFEKKSFLLVEEIKGQCLTDFVAQNWDKLPQMEKEIIINSLAGAIRNIHKAGIVMPDLYLWHIFISENGNDSGDKYNFSFIDLNRMKQTNDKNEKIKNLGRLYHSMIDKYFNEQTRKLLLESYLGKTDGKKNDKFIRSVKKYAAKVSGIRRIKSY